MVCQHEGQGTQTHADERRNVNSSGLMSMLFSWFGTVTLPGNVARVWIMGTMFPCNQVVHCRVAWGVGRVGRYPTACPMQPYLDYNDILPRPRNYCKYFLQFIAFLYLLIILSSANKCMGRKRYLSRPILPPNRPGAAGDPCRGCIKTEKREFSDNLAIH